MNKNIFFTLLIFLFSLSGCTGDTCIDPDDFGFIKFNISSRYKSSELSSRQEGDQAAPWRDSGYHVNGYPLTIVVKPWDYIAGDKNTAAELSAWCPWYGTKDNVNTLSEFCLRLQACKFIDDNMCPSAKLKDAPIVNVPCLMKDGVGLYFLIAARGIDPNISPDSQRSPQGITQHLGEKVHDGGYQFYSVNKRGQLVQSGGINYHYSGVISSDYALSPLYFKILDKFYDDNAGQYRVVIKSGVMDTRPDPLEFLTKLIKEQLFGTSNENPGIIRATYQNIIDTPGYRTSVSALLTLYIMFTGFSFLIGTLNLTHVELVTRVLKVSIISILLSSSKSWQFFHDYLFVFFIDGVELLLQLIKQASSTGPGSQSILGLLIAPQTLSKLFSLLFVDWLGFIYIILYLIALYFIFMLIFKATIIYLTALLTVGMIIIMAPIFLCFMLFSITRSLFENWLRQLISYAIQPIILFTGIAFISMIVRTEIYSTLGFAVCKHDFPDLGPINEIFGNFTEDLDYSLGNSIFYWWFPVPMKGGINNFHRAKILVPMDFTKKDATGAEKKCMAYECVDDRYIELPFLDLAVDMNRIANFINGKFVQLDGLLLIFVSIYLLSKFNEAAIATSRFISSTSGSLTNLQAVSNRAFEPIQRILTTPVRNASAFVNSSVNRLTGLISAPLEHKYEEYMQKRLGREAIDSKSANRAVRDEVKRTYGIDYKNVNENAIKDYKDAIRKLLPDFGAQASDLSKRSYGNLRNKLAESRFGGKDYNALTSDQKKELDVLLQSRVNGKSLRELAADANYTRSYQEAYFKAHQNMSERGVGLFGKNIGVVRDWQEMQNRVRLKKSLREQKRVGRGEKIHSAYTRVKRDLLTAVVGKELRDKYEGNLTSAEWHDFDYNDAALRTYDENLREQERDRRYAELRLKIEQESLMSQDDVLSPEYLARLVAQGRSDDAAYYFDLARQKIAYEVRQKLSEGDDPVIMGDRFMRERATDAQMRAMIDSAHDRYAELLDEDWYGRRAEYYEVMREKAEENIINKYDELRDTYSIEELQNLPEINNDLRNFDYSTQVLAQIEARREALANEVNKYIDNINGYREAAQMDIYENPVAYEKRRLRTLEERLSEQ